MYSRISSLENLILAFYEFAKGKRKKAEVAEFEINAEENVFELHRVLQKFSYKHSSYLQFKISDPKPRTIHKASVRDRTLHQAVYRVINPIFERAFIFDSYSSRRDKGSHRSISKLEKFVRSQSKNYKRPIFALKIDVAKFFDSIDHQILLGFLKEKIKCLQTLDLLQEIIESYSLRPGRGIPLGNVTSQLFGNVYLDPLDKFVKHCLKIKNYIRFCDDIILVREDPNFGFWSRAIADFAHNELSLKLKIGRMVKLKQGFDWLGYVLLPYHRVLRTKTKRRMLRRLGEKSGKPEFNQSLQSYLGVLKHCSSYNHKIHLEQKFKRLFDCQ